MFRLLILTIGAEGGGSQVFKVTENGKKHFFEWSPYVDFEDLDFWHHTKTEHQSFDPFWQYLESVKSMLEQSGIHHSY